MFLFETTKMSLFCSDTTARVNALIRMVAQTGACEAFIHSWSSGRTRGRPHCKFSSAAVKHITFHNEYSAPCEALHKHTCVRSAARQAAVKTRNISAPNSCCCETALFVAGGRWSALLTPLKATVMMWLNPRHRTAAVVVYNKVYGILSLSVTLCDVIVLEDVSPLVQEGSISSYAQEKN